MKISWDSLSAIERQVMERFFQGTLPSGPIVHQLMTRGLVVRRGKGFAISDSGMTLMLSRFGRASPVRR